MEFATFTAQLSEAVVKLETVRDMAIELMVTHGLEDWKFEFDRASQRAGLCRRSDKTISLSEPLMTLWTLDQCRDTILHEIAHALTKGHHGTEWKRMCLMIGADPTRTWGKNGEQSIEARYTGVCPAGHVISRHRLTKAAREFSCRQCSRYYNERYRFTWKDNSA